MRQENRTFAEEVGRQAALQGLTLVSGNARGADRAAQESCVLLKNDDALLPLSDKVGKVALIGPNADNPQLGGYTVREAIDSFTKAGAYASFEEHTKGQIKPGFLADFVVLGADPFQIDSASLKDIPILQTWLEGMRVW